MLRELLENFVERLSIFQKPGQKAAQTIHGAVLKGGDDVRSAVDLLHGTWLGHPLHPVLTDIVVGSWLLAPLFDLFSLGMKSKSAEQTADALTALGTTAAVPTILAGLADFSTIPQPAAGVGLTHALLNDAAFVAHGFSLKARKDGNRGQGLLFSALGVSLATLGAYLGGHLVFKKRVGVNHAEPRTLPQEWQAVLEVDALPQDKPTRINVEGQPVMLYKKGGEVCALGAACPHAGGPLDEGEIADHRLTCPWHDSVFDVCSGDLVHGPSTYAAPHYETRIREGRIEIRVPQKAQSQSEDGQSREQTAHAHHHHGEG
ncbi:MAG: Rieske 2Fe-2S domain-containing protein [Anaerolineales bacterium]